MSRLSPPLRSTSSASFSIDRFQSVRNRLAFVVSVRSYGQSGSVRQSARIVVLRDLRIQLPECVVVLGEAHGVTERLRVPVLLQSKGEQDVHRALVLFQAVVDRLELALQAR